MTTTKHSKTFEVSNLMQTFASAEKALPYKRVFSLVPFLEGIKGESTMTCKDTSEQMDAFWEMLANIDGNDIEGLRDNSDVQSFIRMMMPSMRVSDEINFISPPFSSQAVTLTSKAHEVFFSGDYLMVMGENDKEIKKRLFTFDNIKLLEAHVLILNRLFNQNYPHQSSFIFTLKNKKESFEQYYHISINKDFINVKYDGKLPELSDDIINELYNNLGNLDFWEQYIPSKNILFEGFALISWIDVTAIENETRLAHELRANTFEKKFTDVAEAFTHRFRSYFQSEDIDVGFNMFDKNFQNVHPDINLTGFKDSEFAEKFQDAKYARSYGKMTPENPYVLVDLAEPRKKSFEKILQDKGYKKVLLFTFYKDDKINLILEIASKSVHIINKGNSKKILSLIAMLEDAYEDAQIALDGIISGTMQQQFTAIHPSIEWKFREVASRYFAQKQYDDKVQVEEIVFNNLLPLYGQADIVNSSNIRNKSIQADLVKNLELVENLLTKWSTSINLHLIDKKLNIIRKLKEEVQDKYNSKTENAIVHFLTTETHPYLKMIKDRYKLPEAPFTEYVSHLDAELGFVYEKRKQYENSVTRLNLEISSYLDVEDQKMQHTLPHYFEKYKTDGVEYNIYLGKDLLENHDYNNFDLKEFKIWQLKTMCKTVRLVDNLQSELPIPMKTAQLVFVYNNPLSIRFRMDEKRFDVDGTYNVRYEILKKRIDKATILGTEDRLTVADKVAIVYVNDSDKTEYLKYLDYLQDRDYITDDIEMLDLNPMQGVDGLKALRITVKKVK